MREITNKLDFIKVFFFVKDTVKRMRSHRVGENICQQKERGPSIRFKQCSKSLSLRQRARETELAFPTASPGHDDTP